MPHIESRNSDDPHDASVFSRLPWDGINLLGSIFLLCFTNVA